jgi:acylphosphatase
VVRVRVTVAGRVQGVWYRQSCRRQAVAAGVAGWVRNNADGTVEAVLEGDPDGVEQVLAWMQVGPPQARVTKLDLRQETPLGERSFSVR